LGRRLVAALAEVASFWLSHRNIDPEKARKFHGVDAIPLVRLANWPRSYCILLSVLDASTIVARIGEAPGVEQSLGTLVWVYSAVIAPTALFFKRRVAIS